MLCPRATVLCKFTLCRGDKGTLGASNTEAETPSDKAFTQKFPAPGDLKTKSNDCCPKLSPDCPNRHHRVTRWLPHAIYNRASQLKYSQKGGVVLRHGCSLKRACDSYLPALVVGWFKRLAPNSPHSDTICKTLLTLVGHVLPSAGGSSSTGPYYHMVPGLWTCAAPSNDTLHTNYLDASSSC